MKLKENDLLGITNNQQPKPNIYLMLEEIWMMLLSQYYIYFAWS